MNPSNFSRSAILAWALCASVIVFVLVGLIGALNTPEIQGDIEQIARYIVLQLPYIVFSSVGALIIGSQPRNTIGWLLMLMGFAVSLLSLIPTTSLTAQAVQAGGALSLTEWLAIWLSGWSWWFLIGPLLLIPVLFPTGRPPSPRWRWVIVLLGLVFLLFLFIITFGVTFGDEETGLSVPNPVGFIPLEFKAQFFNGTWDILLNGVAILCMSAIFFRYRRANFTERQQIKWLLYACAFFLAIYLGQGDTLEGALAVLVNAAFILALLGIPIAIGIAILRYRLFDIDVIIRRTLTYALVTALLAVVFLGSVILLQQVFSRLTGVGQNELVTVLSTLAIAALFVPARSRIQSEIDKRFNRKKYNAEQVLSDFATTVRDETDLEKLTARLMQVVDETMQPKTVSVWLKQEETRTRKVG